MSKHPPALNFQRSHRESRENKDNSADIPGSFVDLFLLLKVSAQKVSCTASSLIYIRMNLFLGSPITQFVTLFLEISREILAKCQEEAWQGMSVCVLVFCGLVEGKLFVYWASFFCPLPMFRS